VIKLILSKSVKSLKKWTYDIQFPSLTHLTIDGSFNLDVDCYTVFSNQYENVNATSIFQRLEISIKHLYLFIDK
jgi:hypothetical protein